MEIHDVAPSMLLKVYLRLGSMGLAHLPVIYHKQSPKCNVNIRFVPWIRPGTTRKIITGIGIYFGPNIVHFHSLQELHQSVPIQKWMKGIKLRMCSLNKTSIWVFLKIGVPHKGSFIMENPIEMDDFSLYHYFRKHPYIATVRRCHDWNPCKTYCATTEALQVFR